jgi:hypothetical protein
MFFLTDVIEFKRRRGSKNKIKKSNNDKLKIGLSTSRQARSDVNTVLRTVNELRYWLGR